MLSEREKLEEELRFLKESFEIGVITKEEYEAGKKRAELKSRELDEKEENDDKIEESEEDKIKADDKKEESQLKSGDKEEEKEEVKYNSLKEDKKEEEEKEKESIKENPLKQEKTYPIEEKESIEKEEELIEAKETIEQTETEAEKDELEKEIEENQNDTLKEEQPEIIAEEKKSSFKIFAYLAVVLIVAMGSGYFFFAGDSDNTNSPVENTASFIACHSDGDCSMEGKIGSCTNPGIESAECSYIEDAEVKLKVLNSKDCFNCQTARVMSILKSFYPNLNVENVDFETEEGKEIAERFNLDVLPAYIVDSGIVDAYNYNKLSSAFNEVKDSFVMKNTVSNANYYFARKEISNKLDLFLQPGKEASLKTEKNLKEFLEAFDNVVFEKHDADAKIVKELGINTFPTFLINNKIKFSGVQPADKIKDNFCQVNDLEECGLELSKSLV
ncbi:hypothetical protein CMO93_01280 [Candidatus Woesearchaeota archaeon]|mgnify:CR=1 FL=1|nr:hypothetical protein [Candidatus Woesearchaeota archaeon]|tara:strand:+ start:2426 stop:3760 length:1335 start_codon:yes stop_codon:yes gene_type:complete